MEARISQIIIDCFEANPGKNLSEIKEALDDSFSYSDLNFVRAHLAFQLLEAEE